MREGIEPGVRDGSEGGLTTTRNVIGDALYWRIFEGPIGWVDDGRRAYSKAAAPSLGVGIFVFEMEPAQ